MSRRNAGGVVTVLPHMEMALDSEDGSPATVQPFNPELKQALVVLSLASDSGMSPAKMQASVIAWKRKTAWQTIDTFFQSQSLQR